MHPAKSVIFFTTVSGAGYGLIVWLSILGAFGYLPADQIFGFIAFALGMGMIVAGLLSSTFHLGHPERAWRAMSQWRSSWLSREGVAAILTFAPIGLYAISWIFFGLNTGGAGLVGLVGAAACLITVYCTSMIYASLKSIPAWSNPWTPVAYLALSLGTGGAVAALLMALWRYPAASDVAMGAAAMMLVALFVKLAYWNAISIAPARSTAESATGLGGFGSVRLIDGPHSQSNYLLEEMGFKIARKHASKLRRIAIMAGFAAPILLLAVSAFVAPALAIFLLLLAVAAGGVGIAAERWLFFAEAKHVVTLYYGESRV